MDRFIFAQLADPQIGFQDYDAELLRLRKEIDLLNESDCRIAIICGDMMHRVTRDSLAVFRKEMTRLHIPAYYVAGNHDVGKPEWRACYEEVFGPTYYTVDLAPGLRLIVLDSNRWMTAGDDEAAERMEQQFHADLEKAAAEGIKVIVASHFPIFAESPDEPESYFSLPVKKRKWLLEEMAHAPVCAFLSGHTHTSFAYFLHGILFSSAETTSVAFDHVSFGFRRFVLEGDLIRFQTVPVQ